jgi:hypothetical protein
MKFSDAASSIYKFFASSAWVTTNIVAVPANIPVPNNTTEYVRINVLLDDGAGAKLSKGLLKIDIFVPIGKGPDRSSAIADILESILANKTEGHVQLLQGSLTHLGADTDRPSLERSIYSIPFNHFGEI